MTWSLENKDVFNASSTVRVFCDLYALSYSIHSMLIYMYVSQIVHLQHWIIKS